MGNVRHNIVFFTGAGISAESGLLTFRGENGMWNSFNWKLLATPSAFEEHTEEVLNFYNERRLNLFNAKPNIAHQLIAELEKAHDVTVITQNVDNLHERAGSTKVYHLHGELTKVTSSAHRLDENNIKELPLNIPIKIGDKAADGSQLRPAIVWFGECLNGTAPMEKIVRECDIFVVIGTSLIVSPACYFVRLPHREIPKFIIDPNFPIEKVPEGFQLIQEKATVGMQLLCERIKEQTI